MEFTKQQLSFLEVFGMTTNTKSFLNDKINIQTDDSNIYFSQHTDTVKLIQVFDNITKEKINVTYSTNQFAAMVKSCQDDEKIEISSEGVKFGKNSEYKFESYDISVDDPKLLLDLVSNKNQTYLLIDFGKINNVRNFISSDEDYNCISLQDNNYITFNGAVIAISKSDNNIEEKLYLPAIFFNIINQLKLETVNIFSLQNGEYYNFNVNGLNVFLYIKEYGIPYVFGDEIKSEFEHPYSVECCKKDISNALSRIKIMSQSNPEMRVFVKFTNNKIIIESKDNQYGKEEINATYDKELEDFYLILSSHYLYSIVNLLKGEIIKIFVKPDKEIKAIKIIDEKENNFYVHIPFEYKEN